MPNILLTGATGFIGQAVAVALAQHPAVQLTLLVREVYGLGTPLPAGLTPYREKFSLVYADLRTPSLVNRAVQEARPDVVLHLATQGTTDPLIAPEVALRHNLMGTLHLLQACFEKNVPPQRVILARTPGELVHLNVYSASKAAAWHFAQMYSQTRAWPIVGAMIFQAYGPGQPERTLIPAAVRSALAGEDFPMTAGTNTRDFVYLPEVVEGLVKMALAAELPAGVTVDFGTGVSTSLLEVVQQIYQLVGRGGRPLPGVLPTRPGEQNLPVANITHTQQYLNWHPTTLLPAGLTHYLLHTPKITPS